MQAQMIFKGHTDAIEGVAKSTGNPWRKVTGIFETVEHFPKTIAAKAMRLAVLDWLRRCNAQGTTPSAVLTPLANESTYQRYRRTSA